MELGGDAVLGDDVYDCSPAGVHVAVAGRCYYLVQFEGQLVFLHAFLVIGLADCEQFLATCSRALESFYHALGADRVVTGQYWFAVLETSYDWLHNPAAESTLMGEYLFSKRE